MHAQPTDLGVLHFMANELLRTIEAHAVTTSQDTGLSAARYVLQTDWAGKWTYDGRCHLRSTTHIVRGVAPVLKRRDIVIKDHDFRFRYTTSFSSLDSMR